MTKLGTKDIGSFFTAKRLALDSVTSVFSELHEKIPIADQPCEEKGIAAVGISSDVLDALAKQANFKDISPNDSVSQIGGGSSVVESLVTHRKRENKVAAKSSIVSSKISTKTFGGEMGKPGTEF